MRNIEKLYLSMRAKLSGAVSRIVPNHEVEDVVQETYVKLCLVKNVESIKHPKSYIYTMARNLARDHVKRSEYRLSDAFNEEELDGFVSQDGSRDDVYEDAVSKERFASFCDAVRTLPLQCKKVFVLKKVYGYTQKEIAKELGLSESSVEKHVALGIRKCAQQMEKTTSNQDVENRFSRGGVNE